MANSSMLLNFPNELLLNILDHLPIGDCKALLQASQHPGLQGCYNTRTSVQRHLSKYALDGAALLKALAATDAMIVGALVYEFFFPNSAKSHASWTFVVAVDHVQYFMSFLERQGVRWPTALETLRSLQAAGEDFSMERRQFCRAARASGESSLAGLAQVLENSLFMFVRAQHFSTGWAYKVVPEEYGAAWSVVKGNLTVGDRVRAIELIVPSHREQLQSYLQTLPSTAMQCYINGTGAVHMYGVLTGRGAQYMWWGRPIDVDLPERRWINDLDLEQLRIEPYHKLPAFEPRAPGTGSTISRTRSSADPEAIFISVEPELPLLHRDDEMWAEVSWWPYRLTWREFGYSLNVEYRFSAGMEDHLNEYGLMPPREME